MSLNFVNDHLLASNNLNLNDLSSLLEQMKSRNLDYADLYFQSSYNEEWFLEDNIITDGSYNIVQGVGVRAVRGEKTGFAYADQLTIKALTQSIIAARSIVTEEGNGKIHTLGPVMYQKLYPQINPLSHFPRDEKIAILHQINKIARTTDARVTKVLASLSGLYQQMLIAASDGTLAADVRPLVRLSINVQVEQDGKREHGNNGGGGRVGYDFFLKKINGEVRIDSWTRETVRIALVNLSAAPAPAGYMPVVLGAGWPGVLLHEAVGHGLEGDFNRRGSSIFSGKIGHSTASELCTVVDDATLAGLSGSLAVDDEGIPGQYNILIKNGILKSYMQDKLNAKLMGVEPTGNGRRESYAQLPMPRMTNTYMLSGKSTPKEIIASVDYGIYAKNLNEGQVDITSGKFVFSTSEAYLIEKGHITKPIKRITLIGSGIQIMQQISMVGNDLALDQGVGICIKEGQRLPVGVGQPTLKINKMTVGGII